MSDQGPYRWSRGGPFAQLASQIRLASLEGKWRRASVLTDEAVERLKSELLSKASIPDVAAVVDAIDVAIRRYDRYKAARAVVIPTSYTTVAILGATLALADDMRAKACAFALFVVVELVRLSENLSRGFVERMRDARADIPNMALRLQTASDITEALQATTGVRVEPAHDDDEVDEEEFGVGVDSASHGKKDRDK